MIAFRLLCLIPLFAALTTFCEAQTHSFTKNYTAGISGGPSALVSGAAGTLAISGGGGLNLIRSSDGQVLWRNKYMGAATFGKPVLKYAANGGFLILQQDITESIGGSDLLLFITDSAGLIHSIRYHGTAGDDGGTDVAEAADGDIFISGYTQGFSKSPPSVLYMRINKSGNVLSQHCYGPPADNRTGNCLLLLQNGNILLAGAHDASDGFIMEIRQDGTPIRGRIFQGMQFNDAIESSTGGNYILCGQRKDTASVSNHDMMLLKTDSLLNPLWAISGGFQGNDELFGLCETASGLVAVAGYTRTDSMAYENAAFALVSISDGSTAGVYAASGTLAPSAFNSCIAKDDSLWLSGYQTGSDFIISREVISSFACATSLSIIFSAFTPVYIDSILPADTGEMITVATCIPPYQDPLQSNIICELSSIQNENPENLILYPNPVISGQPLYLNCRDMLEELQFTLYNISGNRLIIKDLNCGEPIHLPDIPPGLYLALVRKKNGEIISQKISVL